MGELRTRTDAFDADADAQTTRGGVAPAILDAEAPWTWANTDTGERGGDATSADGRGGPSTHRRPRSRMFVVRPEGLEALAFELFDTDIVVGRTAAYGATLVLADATVSRRHAALPFAADLQSHGVVDLGSHNGTSVNGRPLEPQGAPRWLRGGDVVRFGDVVCVYERGLECADAEDPLRRALPGASLAACRLRADVRAVARDRSPVLLVGESGSGKEHAARAIHHLSGRVGPFVAVNCSTLSPQLVESLLFGHEAGAFTGAGRRTSGLFRNAQGGTLLLDEVGELPLEVQPKLLRVLQDGLVRALGAATEVAVDVRVIAATHRNLGAMVRAGTFRHDLLARLALVEVAVPPLRARRADVLRWLRLLEDRWREERGLTDAAPRIAIGGEVAEALLLQHWETNMRGLDATVRRVALRAPDGGGQLTMVDLAARNDATPAPAEVVAAAPPPLAVAAWGSAPRAPSDDEATWPPPLRPTARPPIPDRQRLLAALRAHGSIRATARHLERDRRQIYRWIDAFAIDPGEWGGAGDSDPGGDLGEGDDSVDGGGGAEG